MSNSQRNFDVDAVRKDFPILSEKINGKPLVYLDNAASAQKPQAVIRSMVDVMEHAYANVHRGLHTLANRATEAFEDSRETVRDFLNAAEKNEIVFTRSATDALNLVADSFGRLNIEEGDEIILSIMEHHSNIVPWHFLRERKGAVIRWAPIDRDGNFLIDDYKKLFSSRTKIVAVTHMSNVLGTLTPLEEIIRIAHERGVPVLVDGSQGAVHRAVDVQALDADFYVMTGHKLYGPTGIGVLYGKKKWLEKLPPYQGGGEMIETVKCDRVTYNHPPHRFEAGTPPIIEAIGLGAALRYMKMIGLDTIHEYEMRLRDYTWERLNNVEGLTLYGNAEDKGAIFSFSMDNAHPHDISSVLDQYGVAVRAGTHCASPLLDYFGQSATCRASLAFYNTFEEVDIFINALIKSRKLFS